MSSNENLYNMYQIWLLLGRWHQFLSCNSRLSSMPCSKTKLKLRITSASFQLEIRKIYILQYLFLTFNVLLEGVLEHSIECSSCWNLMKIIKQVQMLYPTCNEDQTCLNVMSNMRHWLWRRNGGHCISDTSFTMFEGECWR